MGTYTANTSSSSSDDDHFTGSFKRWVSWVYGWVNIPMHGFGELKGLSVSINIDIGGRHVEDSTTPEIKYRPRQVRWYKYEVLISKN